MMMMTKFPEISNFLPVLNFRKIYNPSCDTGATASLADSELAQRKGKRSRHESMWAETTSKNLFWTKTKSQKQQYGQKNFNTSARFLNIVNTNYRCFAQTLSTIQRQICLRLHTVHLEICATILLTLVTITQHELRLAIGPVGVQQCGHIP